MRCANRRAKKFRFDFEYLAESALISINSGSIVVVKKQAFAQEVCSMATGHVQATAACDGATPVGTE